MPPATTFFFLSILTPAEDDSGYTTSADGERAANKAGVVDQVGTPTHETVERNIKAEICYACSDTGNAARNCASLGSVGDSASRTYAPLTAVPAARHSGKDSPIVCPKANPPLK